MKDGNLIEYMQYCKDISSSPYLIDGDIDEIINALKLKDRYSWHDLRKNPEDLPEAGMCVVTAWKFDTRVLYAVDERLDTDDIKFIKSGYGPSERCIGWCEIDLFKEES